MMQRSTRIGLASVLAALLLGAVGFWWEARAPRIGDGATRLALDPDTLAAWHSHVERCVGRTRPLTDLRGVWVARGVLSREFPAAIGLYVEAGRHIVVSPSFAHDGAVIRHELAHFVRRDGHDQHDPLAHFACAEAAPLPPQE